VSELGFSGVHHVTIPVSDLPASIGWYTTCLAAKHVTRFDHHDQDGAVFAVILQLPGHGPQVQLRTEAAMADAMAGYTPVTLEVADRTELDRWVAYLDAHDIAHSAVMTRRIGDSVDVESPDGLVLRFYTDPVGGIESVEFAE